MIKFIYVLGAIGITVFSLALMFHGTDQQTTVFGTTTTGMSGTTYFFIGLIFLAVGNLLWRVGCEQAILFFSIHERLRSMDRSLSGGGPAAPMPNRPTPPAPAPTPYVAPSPGPTPAASAPPQPAPVPAAAAHPAPAPTPAATTMPVPVPIPAPPPNASSTSAPRVAEMQRLAPQPSRGSSTYCLNCGSRVESGERFCSGCGRPR